MGPLAGRWLRRAVLVAVVFAFAFPFSVSAPAQDSKGTAFWLAFPGNYVAVTELSLFITSETTASGTVSIPGLSFTAPFAVTPGTVTTVALPTAAELQNSDTIEDRGIHVTANAEVTVYGLSRRVASTDAYLGLPIDALGTDYVNLGYKNVNVFNATQFGLVATQDSTAVTITPTETTDGHSAGTPYTITLNQGQTYLLRNTGPAPADLSGTIITSTKPIAVFGGHGCANIPPGFFACDHIVEELPPTTAWGKNFVSMPLATRTGGDTFRILASENSTTVNLNGATVATLNRGQLHEQIVTGPAQITADKPILVMQYSNSSSFDGVTSDPFQMMIPPFEQFLARYTVSTPASGFAVNDINVVAPNAAVGSITLDGAAIPAASFTTIGSSGFSGAQVPVTLGSHTLSGPLPFGVHSYGFDSFDSYGYPGGLSVSEVARVTSVTLAPKTASNQLNTQHCVTASVKDQNNNPLQNIRVDFGVSGANSASGFAFTSVGGEAQFCYTGMNTGNDTITATVGTLSDTAAKTWTPEVPVLDHFKCYTLSEGDDDDDDDDGVTRPRVTLEDQFGSGDARVGPLVELCNPVSKDGGTINQNKDHLVKYRAKPVGRTFSKRRAEVTNQFGTQIVKVRKPAILAVPSSKSTSGPPGDPPMMLDHFQCYRIVEDDDDDDDRSAFTRRTVVLKDQFKEETVRVRRALALCNPVEKTHEGTVSPIGSPDEHLVCYAIKAGKFAGRVSVRNQFGDSTLRVRRPVSLCLPSQKRELPPPLPDDD